MQTVLAELRAACELVHTAPGEIDAISVVGRLPPGATALPLLAHAESLAREFGCRVLMSLAAGGYEIRLWRTGGASR